MSEKHELVQKQFIRLNRKVHIKKLLQKNFRFDTMFADYFSGRLTTFQIPTDSPLVSAGTEFQKSDWRQIEAIPYGSCITYKELAVLAGSPKSSRAVGMARGANPVAVIIPCHRVVAVNGLGGFAGGVAIKKALLALEHTGAKV